MRQLRTALPAFLGAVLLAACGQGESTTGEAAAGFPLTIELWPLSQGE